MEHFTFCGIRSHPTNYSSPEKTTVYQNHHHVVKKLTPHPHNNEGIHKNYHLQNSNSMNSLRALMETEENYLRTKYLLAETQTVARELKHKNAALERQIVSLLQHQHPPATTPPTTTTTVTDETATSTTSSISSYCNGDLNTVNTNLTEEISRLYELLRDREDKLHIRSSEVERLNVDLTAASHAYVKTEGDKLEIIEKNRKAVKTLLKELMIRDQTIADGRKRCEELERERSDLTRRIDVLTSENQLLKDKLNEVTDLIDNSDNDNSSSHDSSHDDGFAIVRINDDHPAAATNQYGNVLKDVNKVSTNDRAAVTTKTRKLVFHQRQHNDHAMIDKENACHPPGHGTSSSSTATQQQQQQQHHQHRGFKRRLASSLFSSSSHSSSSSNNNSSKKPPYHQKRTASSLIKAVIPISRNRMKTLSCPNLPQNNKIKNLTTIDGLPSSPSLSSSSLSLLLSQNNEHNEHNDGNIVTAGSWHGMATMTNTAKKEGEGDDFSDATWAYQNVFSDVDDEAESIVDGN